MTKDVESQENIKSQKPEPKTASVVSTTTPIPKTSHFKTTSFKNLPEIVGKNVTEIELEDVLYYKENEDEYKIQKGERLIPYIVRMNERFKTKAETRIRTRTAKKGFKVVFFIVMVVLAVILLFYLINKFGSNKS